MIKKCTIYINFNLIYQNFTSLIKNYKKEKRTYFKFTNNLIYKWNKFLNAACIRRFE